MAKAKNDRNQAVTKFCLAMEEHRRTEAGRVRTARELVANFFPYDDSKATDKLFHLMPNEVRGPILSQWGIRGGKAALKDDDAKVQNVVHDALVAGDIDEAIFEEGVTPPILIDWIALPDWWSFWRRGKLTGVAIQKALATARELALIDDRWFLDNIQGRGGKLKGTDVICDTLSKDQVVAWMRKLHETGDGTPLGLVTSLGWEMVLAKTAQDALLFALDQFAKKAALVTEAPDKTESTAAPPVAQKDAAASPPEPVGDQVPTAVPAPGPEQHLKQDSGFPIAIPDVPAVDAGDDDPPSTPSMTSMQEQALWGAPTGESEKLVEARAKMIEMLGNETAPPPSEWGASDIPPQKPSSLDWGEAPQVPFGGAPAPEAKPAAPAPPPLPPKKPAPPPRR